MIMLVIKLVQLNRYVSQHQVSLGNYANYDLLL